MCAPQKSHLVVPTVFSAKCDARSRFERGVRFFDGNPIYLKFLVDELNWYNYSTVWLINQEVLTKHSFFCLFG